MRIIAGRFKSRKLSFPRSNKTRPTMDRVKETLFNVLGEQVEGARVLDLYAGCGSLGFEALSRGASSVVFVDSDPHAIRCLQANADTFSVREEVRILKTTVFEALTDCQCSHHAFDIILIDPPYDRYLAKKTLLKIYGFDILAPNGILVIEHAAHEQLPIAKHIEIITHKKFGQTQLSFFISRIKEGFHSA